MLDFKNLSGPSVSPASGGPPKSLVLLLHGYGSSGADLISLAPYWQAALPDTLFIAPDAPMPCPGVRGGYQWWALTSLAPAARAAGVREAAPILNAFIDAQLELYNLAEEKLALVGFSQGTMMALHVGPRREQRIAGIIGYSGMLADPIALKSEMRTKPNILLVHGDKDGVLPVEAMYEAQTTLSSLGFEVSSHVSAGLAHSVDDVGLRLGVQFLSDNFA
jgi:phospholipase/carboxylesterase